MKFFTITQQMVSSRSLLLGRSLNGNGNVVNSLMTAFYSSRPALAIDMSEETSSSGLSHPCPQPPDTYLPPQIIYSLNTNTTKKLYSDQLKTVENTKNSELRFSTSNKNENDKSMTPMTTSNGPNDGRAPLEKILAVKEELVRHLPKFLKETHPYRLYTPDVIFENFYHEPGRVYVGALQYAIQLSLIRIKLNWKFSHARVEILKITHDESESTIKIRWRVNGIGGMKSMLQVWKFNLMKLKNSIKKETEWIDGFSILYLNKNGHIYKHTLQRVMTQEATDKAKDKKIKNLAINTTMCSNCSCSGHS